MAVRVCITDRHQNAPHSVYNLSNGAQFRYWMFTQLDQIISKKDSKIFRTLLKYTHIACTVALTARTQSAAPYTAGNTNLINIYVKVKVKVTL